MWKILMLSAATMHIAIAWSITALIGPASSSAGLMLLRRIFPDEIWPVWFLITALLAVGGLFNVQVARAHFISGAMIMFFWAVASFAQWPERGPQPGAFLLLHIAVLKFACGLYANRLRRLAMAVERLGVQVDRAEGTLRGAEPV